MEAFGTWAFMVKHGKWLQHPIFLGNEPFTSQRVPVLGTSLSFGSRMGGGGESSVPGSA